MNQENLKDSVPQVGVAAEVTPETPSAQETTPTPAPKSPKAWRILSLVLALLLIAETLGLGIYHFAGLKTTEIGDLRVETKDAETLALASKMGDVFHILKDNYYQPLSDDSLWEAMVSGTASHVGSRFTNYMTKEEVEAFRQGVSGHYSGIGATVQLDQNTGAMSLVGIREGSPAMEAGLQDGDVLVSVDGKPISDFPNPAALASQVKGPEGSEVTLTVYRPSEDKELTVTAIRADIQTISVNSRRLKSPCGPDLGYIRIREFTETLPDQFIPALENLVQEGAKGIVLDLRNNPGGDAGAMATILDAILAKGPIASIEGRHNGKAYKELWETTGETLIPEDIRFVILLNRASASASEFFSGAMRDRGRAEIVGKQTYGKGVATQTFGLSDGSALNVTTFEYVLPSGEHVEGVGLAPDYEVELPPEAAHYTLDTLPYELDAQLQKAIELLCGNKPEAKGASHG